MQNKCVRNSGHFRGSENGTIKQTSIISLSMSLKVFYWSHYAKPTTLYRRQSLRTNTIEFEMECVIDPLES